MSLLLDSVVTMDGGRVLDRLTRRPPELEGLTRAQQDALLAYANKTYHLFVPFWILLVEGVIWLAACVILMMLGMGLFFWGREEDRAAWLLLPLVVPAFVAVQVARAWVERQHVRRFLWVWRPRLCSRCGYDLHATPERCPECGLMAPSGRAV